MGNAKVISARAEVNSAKLMREAADILSTPAAMQIRYLETMNQLAKAPNTRVIFMPSDAENKHGHQQGMQFTPAQIAGYQTLTQWSFLLYVLSFPSVHDLGSN